MNKQTILFNKKKKYEKMLTLLEIKNNKNRRIVIK